MAEGRGRDGIPIARDDYGTEWKFVFTFFQGDFDIDAEHCLPNYKRSPSFWKHCKATNFKVLGLEGWSYGDLTPTAKWSSGLPPPTTSCRTGSCGHTR